MRSSAPGAKFSTSTSHFLTSASRTCLALGVLGVDRDRALVLVEHREVQAVHARNVAQLAARDVALAGAFDLDHVGAQPREQLRARRPDCTWVKSRMRTPSSALPISALRPCLSESIHGYFLRTALCGLSLPMLPLSVPAAGSMTALMSVGLPESIAASTARFQLVGRRRIHADAAEGLHHLVVARAFDEDGGRRIEPPAIDVGSAIDAVVVEDDDADRQVVAANRLDFHAGEAEGAVAFDREHRLAGFRWPRRRSPCRCP